MAAAEARSHGHGGIAAVVRATGISGSTVLRGLAELESGELPAPGRVRRPGGGKRPISETQPGIEDELERLVAPETRGDRESPLRWTSRSAVKLTRGLAERGYEVSESIAADEPAISIDSKNASLVGDFKAVGRELEPTGCPVAVRSQDFKDKQLGHAIPLTYFEVSLLTLASSGDSECGLLTLANSGERLDSPRPARGTPARSRRRDADRA